jgi:hypothetical protein
MILPIISDCAELIAIAAVVAMGKFDPAIEITVVLGFMLHPFELLLLFQPQAGIVTKKTTLYFGFFGTIAVIART